MPRVFVEGSNHLITRMFVGRGWGVTTNLEHADLVCFEGGADVSPELYGEVNMGSYCDQQTDWESLVLFNNARRLGLPCVGICRGGQFLNVIAGGKMIQHVSGHATGLNHMMYTHDHDFPNVEVTSTHHQMMVVNEDFSDLIGWANEDDPEVVYHFSHMLSFQPHPEYVERDHPCQEYFFSLLGFYFELAES